MELIKGIGVFNAKLLTEKIFLSNGVEKVDFLNGYPAEKDTFIPKSPWRKATPSEIEILGDFDLWLPHQTVGIIRLPESLIQKIKKSKINEALNSTEYNRVIGTNQWKEIFTDIGIWCNQYSFKSSCEPIAHVGCFKPNLTTITYNEKKSIYIGLHLDSWDEKLPNELHLASNRICINLGTDRRSFLFSNFPVQQLFSNFSDGITSPQQMIKRYLNENKTYPIVRIDIQPFEAYIAPTENLIHDGSSLGQRFLDINYSTRGFFSIDKSKNIY